MRDRKRSNINSKIHFGTAYGRDIFDGKGDKSRLPLAGRYATFDGIASYLSVPHLIGSETVLAVNGDVLISDIIISTSRIDVTSSGKIWNLLLSDGTFFTFSEGSGVVLNDIGNGKVAILVNPNVGFWHLDGIQGEGHSGINTEGYSSFTSGVGTGHYSSAFTKNYSTNGITMFGFIQIYSSTFCGLIGSSTNVFGIRANGASKIQFNIGGFANGTNSVEVNISARTGAFMSFSINNLGEWTLHINGVLISSGTITAPVFQTTNVQLYTRNNTTQRFVGNVAQIGYFDGTLSDAEHFELYELACKNNVEAHTRFSDCDLYIKGGDNGLAEDYSNNNTTFTLVGSGFNVTYIPNNDYRPYKQYNGAVHYPIKVKEHCLTSSGISMKLSFDDLTGVSITSFQGTSTPSIVGNYIELTAGNIYNLLLSDGTHLPLTEGFGTTVYDISGNGNHGTISNPDSDCWDYFQYGYSNNHRGYHEVFGAKIPASKTNHHKDVLGNDLTHFTLGGKYIHQDLEIKLNSFDAPEIFAELGVDSSFVGTVDSYPELKRGILGTNYNNVEL